MLRDIPPNFAKPLRHPLLWILVLALVLRLINITVRTLWYDEAFAVLFAEKGLSAMLYGTLTPVAGGASDIHPLLYYSTLHVWMSLFGQNPFAVRFWSVILGLFTILIIYAIANLLFDRQTALLAAFITAIAPFHVQYSQEVRMYSLLGLLLLATTYCFLRAWFSASSRRWWALFGFFAALAMYTQQLAAFYLIAIGLVPFIARRRDKLNGLMLGVAIALLVYLPWLWQMPSQLQKVNAYYWLPRPNAARLLLAPRSFLSLNADIPVPWGMVALVSALLLVIFLLIQTIFYLRRPRRRSESDRNPLFFALWLAGAPVLLMWLVSQIQPVYLERALLPSALMLYIALAWMFTRSGFPRPVAVVLAMIGFTLSGIGLYYHYTWNSFPNSPFEQAAQYIQSQFEDGDVIIHQNKLSALPMIYYNRNLPQRYLADIEGSPEDTLARPTQEALQLLANACIQSAARDARRIWFVLFSDAPRQYEAAGRTDLSDTLTWLDEHYQQAGQFRFNDLDIWLYDAPHDIEDYRCD